MSDAPTRDESYVAIVSFHGALKREAAKVRALLADANIGSSFTFQASVSGRVQDGEVEVKYKLEGPSYGDHVEGNELNAVVEEFLRRKGWTKQHAPKLISKLSNDSDIPF